MDKNTYQGVIGRNIRDRAWASEQKHWSGKPNSKYELKKRRNAPFGVGVEKWIEVLVEHETLNLRGVGWSPMLGEVHFLFFFQLESHGHADEKCNSFLDAIKEAELAETECNHLRHDILVRKNP